ncbi:hypothetical protein OESDEN_02381 [Oesophagostomum dentatum]|uniref:Uncharacterized protein n=1 Tax=Oesophagostomum dentatum TaxID=61180 RepID=A0A0B1TKA7_OESDE|nr:hypothetical protein OESDEN_02381 [Oesophagostomum dentatum]
MFIKERDHRQQQTETPAHGSRAQIHHPRDENEIDIAAETEAEGIDDRQTAVDSRPAVGEGARHSQPTHHRSHHLEVPQDPRAYPDSVVDPNAILSEPRPTPYEQRRPDWSEGRRTEDADSGSMPGTQPRDEVRVRYVKPPVIVTDQYGRRYRARVENGQTYYDAVQDATAERRPTEDRRQQDTEGWRTVGTEQSEHRPQQGYGQVQEQDQSQRQGQQDTYEARRRAYHEEYNRALQQRRLEAQRRREEEEKRRAEMIAQQEAGREYEGDRSRYQPQLLDKEVRDERFAVFKTNGKQM